MSTCRAKGHKGSRPSLHDIKCQRDYLLDNAYAFNSSRVAKTALNSYQGFACQHRISRHNISVYTLSLYIAYLSCKDLSPNTIITYVSALAQIFQKGDKRLTNHFLIKRLLRSIRKNIEQDKRLPITNKLLARIILSLPAVCYNKYEASMFASMFSVAFFGLCRVSEVTATRRQESAPQTNLLAKHVRFDNTCQPNIMKVKIVRSKTDQAGKATWLHIARLHKPYCPWKLTQRYIKQRPIKNKAFYVHRNGQLVSDKQFNKVLQLALNFLDVPLRERYSSHSFRIGGCTMLSDKGLSESAIKRAGRWRSHAYAKYIRQPTIMPW